MNTNHEFDADWILEVDNAGADDFVPGDDWSEAESSSLTWDEETVRELHREISWKARRASSERSGW